MMNYELKIKNYLVVLFLMLSVGWGQLVDIQGIARDSNGNTVADGTYSLTFRLYTASTGGTAAWTETQSLTVTEGVFNANLGSVTSMSSLSFSTTYWLSVQVAKVSSSGVTEWTHNEISTRSKMVLTPYAIMGSLSGTANVYPSSGSIGIGTTTPDEKLSVIGEIRAAAAENESEYVEMGHSGSDGFVNTAGDGHLKFQHDGSSKMVVRSNANVGLGTTNPKHKLHIVDGNIYLGEGGSQSTTGKITWDLNDGTPTDYHWLGYDNDIDPWWMILQTHQNEGVRFHAVNDGDIMIVGGSTNDQTTVGKGARIKGDLKVTGDIYNKHYRQWKLLEVNTFQSGSDGWSGAHGGSTSDCGASNKIYGGYDRAGGNEILRKSWDPPSGFRYVKIELELFAVDSWDDELIFIYSEGNWKRNMRVYRSPRQHNSTGKKICGRSDWKDRMMTVTILGEWDGSGEVKIAVDSHSSSDRRDESFGVDNVHFYMR